MWNSVISHTVSNTVTQIFLLPSLIIQNSIAKINLYALSRLKFTSGLMLSDLLGLTSVIFGDTFIYNNFEKKLGRKWYFSPKHASKWPKMSQQMAQQKRIKLKIRLGIFKNIKRLCPSKLSSHLMRKLLKNS